MSSALYLTSTMPDHQAQIAALHRAAMMEMPLPRFWLVNGKVMYTTEPRAYDEAKKYGQMPPAFIHPDHPLIAQAKRQIERIPPHQRTAGEMAILSAWRNWT